MTSPTSVEGLSVFSAKLASRGWLLLPLSLIALGLNGWVLPDAYDNVMYLRGAVSVAETGYFTVGGWHVADWGPLLSTMMAPLVILGVPTIWAGKLLVFVSVPIGAFCAYELLRREGWDAPLLAVMLTLAAPFSFLQATRTMADWPYAAASFAFLLLLRRLNESRSVALACGLGLFLGLATLLRHVGVVLGVAVLLQMGGRLRGGLGTSDLAMADLGIVKRARALLPEVLLGVIGASIFLSWKIHLRQFTSVGAAWNDYQVGLDFLGLPNFAGFFLVLFDSIIQGSSLGTHLGLPVWAIVSGALMVISITLWGFVLRARHGRATSTDGYVSATALVLLLIEWHHTRYFLPIHPFIASATITGVKDLAPRLIPSVDVLQRLGRVGAMLWLSFFFFLDVVLLVSGNGRTHGGLSPLLSRTAVEFYRGDWRALYQACDAISGSGPGAVGVYGHGDAKYPAYFCERTIVRIAPSDIASSCRLTPPLRREEGLSLADEHGRPWDPFPPPSNIERHRGAGGPGDSCSYTFVLTRGEEPAELRSLPLVGKFEPFTVRRRVVP